MLNGLPMIVEIISVRENNGKPFVNFKTNRFEGFLVLGECGKKNLLGSNVEQIGIGLIGQEFCIFEKGWSNSPTNDIRDLARKVIQAIGDTTWRKYVQRNRFGRSQTY